MWVLLAATAVLLGVLVLLLRIRPRRGSAQEKWLPHALHGATLAFAETTFRSTRRRLVARVDRAYRHGGQIVLVELKTRAWDAAFTTDVIELSVQRAALSDQTGEAVSRTAWVLVESTTTKNRRPHKVELLSDDALDALIVRYRSIRAGRALDLQPAARATMCRTCGHLARCRSVYQDRPSGKGEKG